MDHTRRWKRLWLAGAGILLLAVIVWAAFLFTAGEPPQEPSNNE